MVAYLRSVNLISVAEKDSIDEELSLNHFFEAADLLSSMPSAIQYKKVSVLIRDGMSDGTDSRFTLPVRHRTVAEGNEERLLPFSYKTASLAVMPVCTIIKETNNMAVPDLESTCSKILDLIWVAYKDNDADLNYVWECFRGQHDKDYFLLTNEPDTDEMNWRLYSYAYFCYVNEYRFERPSVLNFAKETPFSTTIPYNSNNKYEQYFDAYNVKSESKYADDILLRFLRMYQMLEYMAFRRVLADMTKGNIKQNGFVRNIISRANKGSEKEFEELKKGLKDVLPDLSTLITQAEITIDMQAFIKDRLMIKNINHDNSKLWEVVYQLRNSIVHNKESELHFMYANTSVYEPGIALMKLLIEKVEPVIIGVINDPGKTQLEFTEQRVQVY